MEYLSRKTAFAQIIRDSYYLVNFFYTDTLIRNTPTDAFITVYDTGNDTFELLKRIIPELDISQGLRELRPPISRTV